jgi:hypothetical protein
MLRSSQAEFVRQQGFACLTGPSRAQLYGALMFQPRLVSTLVAAGIVFQHAELFLALSAILLWSAALPALNPFDALYNLVIAGTRELPRLGPAPAPRRFAQAMASTFMLVIGVSLLLGWQTTAWIAEALLAAALLALLFGRFCLGSFIFHQRRKSGTPATV